MSVLRGVFVSFPVGRIQRNKMGESFLNEIETSPKLRFIRGIVRSTCLI